jgi:hypothetical protein
MRSTSEARWIGSAAVLCVHEEPSPERAALERDKQIGQRAGVHATPTVIRKTARHGGFRSESELKAFLQEDWQGERRTCEEEERSDTRS